MWELEGCTVCFSTGVKLYNLDIGTLRKDFNSVSGLQRVQRNGMPNYLCMECAAYVRKFIKFRLKCQRAHYALEQVLIRNKEINIIDLKEFNRQQLRLMPTLAYIDLNKAHYEQVQYKLVNYCRSSVSQLGLIPIAHYSTLTSEDTFESEMKEVRNTEIENHVKIEIDHAIQMDINGFTDKIPSILHEVLTGRHVPSNESSSTVQAKTEPLNSELLSRTLETQNDYNEVDNYDAFEAGNIDDVESDTDNNFSLITCKLNNKVDGSSFNEEYGDLVAISVKEAKAAAAVHKFCSVGKFRCNCGRRFASENTIKQHARRHDMHVSGHFHCEICDYYFKTAFLLECHMSDKHMYKYLCKKCPEVTFSRIAAKQHYIWKHMQNGRKHEEGIKWEGLTKPSWLGSKGGVRIKGTFTPKLTKRTRELPKDFPMYSPITQEEQYLMVQKRKESRNYLEAKFKCELCFRGYRLTSTFNKHMAKHDPKKSGIHQCDMCKHYFRDTRKLYKHLNMYHLYKYSCRYCDSVFTNRGQAWIHYRWHKNVTYDCPHCDKTFTKISTQLTHIRFKHPSTDICNLCGHSFVSSSGLHCHKQMSHSKEEMELSSVMTAEPDRTGVLYCDECKMQFQHEVAYNTHLSSSRRHVETNLAVIKHERSNRRTERLEAKGLDPNTPLSKRPGPRGRPRATGGPRPTSEVLNTGTTTATNCEVCGLYLASDVTARKHYEAEHPGTDYLKRYMCELCGHTTKQYANLLVHMRVHTLEKPYGCPHCDRRFSMPSNRDRHLVVHTGEKRYQCQHCSRRFTQSTAVKLHIQTVHMKIPYKPWDKKNRKRRKEMEPNTAGLDMVNPGATTGLSAAIPVQLIAGPAAQHKLLVPQGDYIQYITYADEQ